MKNKKIFIKTISAGLISCMLGYMLFLTPTTGYAASLQERAVNNEVHYEISGETVGPLDYGRTDYVKTDENGNIHLNVTKWATGSAGWGGLNKGAYNGRYILNFFNDQFYKISNPLKCQVKNLTRKQKALCGRFLSTQRLFNRD